MKNISALGTDVAFALAIENGFVLGDPVHNEDAKLGKWSSLSLQGHGVDAVFYVRPYHIGLHLAPKHEDLFDLIAKAIPALNTELLQYKKYEIRAESYAHHQGRYAQFNSTDFRDNEHFAPRIKRWLGPNSSHHNLWANEMGVRLFYDFIEPLMPLIK